MYTKCIRDLLNADNYPDITQAAREGFFLGFGDSAEAEEIKRFLGEVLGLSEPPALADQIDDSGNLAPGMAPPSVARLRQTAPFPSGFGRTNAL